MDYTVTLDPVGSTETALNLKYYNARLKEGGEEIMVVAGLGDIPTIDFGFLEEALVSLILEKNKTLAFIHPNLKVVIYAFEVMTIAVAKGTVNGTPITFERPLTKSATYFVDGEIVDRPQLLVSECNGDVSVMLEKFPTGTQGLKAKNGTLYMYVPGKTQNIIRRKNPVAAEETA